MKFTKTYTGLIKRKTSEGVIVPTTLPELYLKTSNNKVEIHNNTDAYPSKVFNIVQMKDKIEVTSNTLGLKFTNIYNNNIPYYREIMGYDGDMSLLVNIDTYIVDNKIYTNIEDPYIQIENNLYIVQDIISINIWNRHPDVTVRKLKDRFKITIKNIPNINIDLISSSIFHPNIYMSNIYYYDCIFNTTDYLSTHSFEHYTKEEVHYKSSTKYSLKDIPIDSILIENISEDYVKIKYKTFRSNLFFTLNTFEPACLSLVYIDNIPEIIKSSFDTDESKKLLVYRPTDNLKIENFELNPYMNIKRFKSRPEGIVFVWKGFENNKYSRPQDISFGVERVVIELNRIVNSEIEVFKINGNSVIQKNESIYSNIEESDYTYEGTNLDNLNYLLSYVRSRA